MFCQFLGHLDQSLFPLSCAGTERPATVTKMQLKLSADHRVFDGEIGGNYLKNDEAEGVLSASQSQAHRFLFVSAGKFLSALALNLNDVQRLLL